MLSFAEERMPKTLPTNGQPAELRNQDAFDLSGFEDGSYDAIWFCAVMVHLPRRFAQKTLQQVSRILKSGGIVYVSAQRAGDAVFRREGRFFVYYTAEELEATFQGAGLQVLKRWHDTADKGTCGDKRTKFWLNYFLTRSAS